VITGESGPARTIASGYYETTVNGAYESADSEPRLRIQEPIVPRKTADTYQPRAHCWQRINLCSMLGSRMNIDLSCGPLGAIDLDYSCGASDASSRFEGEVLAFTPED